MSNKIFIIITLLLVALIATSVNVHAVNAKLDLVEVEGVELKVNDTTRLNVVRGEEIEVLVKITGTSNNSNVEIEAFISGHEPNSETLSDVSEVFDVEKDVSYVKRLKLRLPTNVEKDNYKLRVLVTDRFGSADVYNFDLKVDTDRHLIVIKDIVLRPPFDVKPGRALLVTVELENQGQKDEEGIKVTASIPELNVQGSEFVNELDSEETTTTEEIFLRIPENARPGSYDVEVEVKYNDGFKKTRGLASIEVIGEEFTAEEEAPETTVMVTENNKDMYRGKGGAVYPISVTNNRRTSKSYVITVDPADWAEVSVSPSNILVVPGRSTDSFFLLVSAKQDASFGPKLIRATITTSGEPSKQLTLRANVLEKSGLSQEEVTRALETVVVVLLALLVILGIAIAVNKMRHNVRHKESGMKKETRVTKYY